MEKLKLAKHLINFIDESPSNYFACINTKNILNEKGFTEQILDNTTQICWATGGRLVPEKIWDEYLVTKLF